MESGDDGETGEPWCKGAGRTRGGWLEPTVLRRGYDRTAQDRPPTAVAHLTGPSPAWHELPSCRSPDVDGGATRFFRLAFILLRASLLCSFDPKLNYKLF